MRISAKDTPAASTFTRTSLARGSGSSSSDSKRFSGPPNRDITMCSYFIIIQPTVFCYKYRISIVVTFHILILTRLIVRDIKLSRIISDPTIIDIFEGEIIRPLLLLLGAIINVFGEY